MSAGTTVPASVPEGAAGAMPDAARRAVRAGVLGNLVDNVHVFLPVVALAPVLSLLLGSSAAGSVVVVAMLFGRPVGAALFGRLSDRHGRSSTTRWAIVGTAACALAIALLPSHRVLGVGTLVLLLALRFAGGVFVAGEYSAAIPLAMEWSPPRLRGLFSGLVLSMASWAQALIAFATAGLLRLLGVPTYARWGWRGLFLAGTLGSCGMLAWYLRVRDAPRTTPPGPTRDAGTRDLLLGRHARAFWTAFALMSGLWLLTDTTVLVLPGRLASDAHLGATSASLVMGLASVVQALAMVGLGHLSTRCGRRGFFAAWGVVVVVLAPACWWFTVHAHSVATAALGAAALQACTVSGYGPVAAHLSELFPRPVRSRGYGLAYSWSLVLPALYPFYLPALQRWWGHQGSVLCLLVLAGALVTASALATPRAAREHRPLDDAPPPPSAADAREPIHA